MAGTHESYLLQFHCLGITTDDIPPYILQQITSCATATNEFLRQFWKALYPAPPQESGSTLSTLTPAQREAKMIKMIGYIARTHEKVGAVILTAQHAGVELKVVETVSAHFSGD